MADVYVIRAKNTTYPTYAQFPAANDADAARIAAVSYPIINNDGDGFSDGDECRNGTNPLLFAAMDPDDPGYANPRADPPSVTCCPQPPPTTTTPPPPTTTVAEVVVPLPEVDPIDDNLIPTWLWLLLFVPLAGASYAAYRKWWQHGASL
jgi:hypothetical protein